MIKHIADRLWAFDCEWCPCPETGRRLYGLPVDMPDRDVIDRMFALGGATPEEPRPYLKTVLCQIVSIAMVQRRVQKDGRISLALLSIPNSDESLSERTLLTRLFAGLRVRPQLCGFNSVDADFPALLQRALACGVHAPQLQRPDKPWLGVDYFGKASDWHIDLKYCVGGFGRSTPSLNELAAACRIPGKLGVSGGDVVDLVLAGEIRQVVQYNEWDALTTYLLWLRVATLMGFFTPKQRLYEERLLVALLETRGLDAEHAHLHTYLDAWYALGGPHVDPTMMGIAVA